jgi:hypothetical protein
VSGIPEIITSKEQSFWRELAESLSAEKLPDAQVAIESPEGEVILNSYRTQSGAFVLLPVDQSFVALSLTGKKLDCIVYLE